MFGLQSVLGIPHKTDPRQDSTSSTSSRLSVDSKPPELTSRGSSTFSFLSRSSKRLAAEPPFQLSCEVAIRPSFCWNSHQDTWQAGGVWSQFESGLKSCQADVCACTNFMGHKDAAFAGVFDGHGFNGRSAATYARKNIIKWLSVDSNATSKDPKKRSRALESVCSQIYRGLARSELCGFDASSSGLAACFGIVQGNKLCLAAMGNCKAVLGRTDTKSSSRLHAIALTTPASTRGSRHGSGLGLRHMQSMPAPLAASTPASPGPPEGLLGRDPVGEQPHATPAMSVHQLSSQDQFVVLATSGLWEVMTAQEVVDFVHQCRHCRPDNLSCCEALTLEAHTRWKLKFSKVIAEDVAAVIIHCGAVLHPAQPSHHLPAFPEAATNNHEANDDNTLHETREFWGRLQPQSLVPLLQSASSKGKGRMPSSYLPFQPPSALKSNGHLPSGHLPIERPSPSQSLPSHPSQSDVGAASSSQSGPQDGLFAYDSSPSAARQERRRRSSAAREAPAGRSVHFALPLRIESSDELDTDADQSCASSPDPCTRGSGNAIASCGDTLQQGSKSCVEIPVPERSSPLEISLRPDTPDVTSDLTPRIVSSSGRSSLLSSESTEAVPAASSPSSSSHSLQALQANSHNSPAPTPFAAAAALMRAGSTDLSEAESEFSSTTPRSSFDGQEPRRASSHAPPTKTARALLKSPKSPKSPSRAHAQQPLDESEGRQPLLAKLCVIERTHSAPGGVPFGMLVDFAGGATRPRIRLPVSIPEDRPVAAAAPAEAADSVTRPFRKIYPHGSDEEADTPESDYPETTQQILPASLGRASNSGPQSLHEGRVHSRAYPTSSQLLSEASLPRVEFPKLHAAVTSAPDWAGEPMEGQMRGGFPRVSSHPENLAGLAATAAVIESPFARHPLQSVSAQLYSGGRSPPSPHQPFLANLVNGTSSSTVSSINPWASPTQHSNLLKARRTSALGNRSRNGSAAFDELTRLRSMRVSDETLSQDVPVSSSM